MCLATPCLSAKPSSSTPAKAPALTVKPKQPKATPPGAVKPAGATKAARASKTAPRTEAEISGLSTETSEQLYGRLNLSRMSGRKKWWFKTGYGFTKSRTYGKTRVNETDVTHFNLDAAYRRDGKNNYRFISGLANIKRRSPYTSAYGDGYGYYMLSAGYGRTLFPGLDCEAALAEITQHKRTITDRRITPVYTLRLKSALTPSVTLDSDTHFAQPWTQDSLVDSRINLTYRLTSALSMRLTYVANNILGTALARSDWDKSFRISLVFGRN